MLPVLSEDTDVLVLLENLADDLMCDYKGCSNKAIWSWRCEGCANVTLACDTCKVGTDKTIIHFKIVQCKACNYDVPNRKINWLPL